MKHFLTFLVFLRSCVSHCDPRTLKPHRTAQLPHTEEGDWYCEEGYGGTPQVAIPDGFETNKPCYLVVVDVGDSIRSN